MVHFSLSGPSGSSSRPSSRAPSPTRTTSRSSLPNINVPRSTGVSIASSETSENRNGDYFGSVPQTPGASSGFSTPYYGSYSSNNNDMWSSGAITPGGSYFPHQPVEIILDSEHLVMRGQGGDMNPAYLSGRVELNLAEPTNIKEINMSLDGKAKVQFSEGTATGSKNHHFSHHVLTHEWSFLEGDKKHTHTLKAGHHSFPFSLMLHGNLPSSIHTFSGDAIITYKLRANVVRSGFSSNFHDVKLFTLQRTFTSDALEFNQTLEIENTWPGKIMYALTLPFKAYAAGDDIPVSVKFMPLAKGVRVTHVTSVIKEYTLVHTRHSNHSDERVVSSVKHELRNGKAYLHTEELVRPPAHWLEMHPNSGRNTPARTPRVSGGDQPFPGENAAAGPSSGEGVSEEDLEIGDDEVNTHFTIPIPAWTCSSHSVHPAFITHKIKWSCSISNADGHVSELRCALPIIILDHSMLEEARAAGANTRALLFGGQASEEAQVDLPSYSNHVYDRIAIADSGSAAGYAPRAGISASPHQSITPPISRGPSRPGSPTGSRIELDDDLPPRRELSTWADNELLMSLGSLRVHSNGSSPSETPAASRAPSRPLSRRNSRSGRSSRVGSRAGSRASSPERSGQMSPMVPQEDRPHPERRHTGGLSGLLHFPAKHRQNSKPILRNHSHAALSQSEGLQRNALSFTNLPDRSGGSSRVSFANQPQPQARGARFHVEGPTTPDNEEEDADPINRVPSYLIASRGFLGGGVVPIDSTLPTYDDSERRLADDVARHRSDTALVDLGAQAAAEAEARAGEESSQQQ